MNRLQESVHRLRNDYERCIDSYIVAKAKYEDQYTKVSMAHWGNSRISRNSRTNWPKIGLFGPLYKIQTKIEK